ncbi:MAG TPA: DNA/RNA non-specific endonuclease [Treponemataceae bacterium]|jgi:endonuclease G|nr:MAG: Nuclease precursor [Spirochaetes bacterium ADurb.Bin215]HOF84177.1 DNA/RNA non-specific endonuclease [Treponemataceae bacterium]HOS34294.1 DNA/RNA non-specific endonuclease [Treponemataceae bacterium]HOU39010.1 DNA/RNA non-specific endonuclease [Treponemataceae bacterium]HPA09477.1 DNA/RNA non-specific endonuclease [Treponemataceae bacterium]
MTYGSFLSGVFLLIAQLSAPPAALVELPAYEPGASVVRYTAHTLQYNNTWRNPDWVAYELTAEEAETILVKRASRFVTDSRPEVTSAEDSDYRRSGYDRGHLAPAADMRFSPEAMRDCFYYSNIAPQHPRLNRGIWLTLENRTRQWAKEYGAVFITTGPVYSSGDTTIGNNQVRVPAAFYKVLLDYRSRPPKAAGFLFPNTDEGPGTLAGHMVPVDAVEAATGIDFFAALPDSVEALLEGSVNPASWLSGEGETHEPQ